MSRVGEDVKIAALCLATLVATPYAFGYELVLAIIAALFLARAGIGRTLAGRAWLAALWLLLVPAWFSGFLEVSHYVAPFATASLVYCAWIALRPAARPAAA